MLKYINPEVEGIHPLRLTTSDEELQKIAKAVDNNEDWVTLEQVEAVADVLYDHIAGEKQTHLGITVLQ